MVDQNQCSVKTMMSVVLKRILKIETSLPGSIVELQRQDSNSVVTAVLLIVTSFVNVHKLIVIVFPDLRDKSLSNKSPTEDVVFLVYFKMELTKSAHQNEIILTVQPVKISPKSNKI